MAARGPTRRTMVTDDDSNSLSLAEALGVLQKLKAVSPALARLVQDAVGSEIQARVATGGEARQGKDKEWPELTAEEQDFYNSLYSKSHAKFNTYVESGTLLNHELPHHL